MKVIGGSGDKCIVVMDTREMSYLTGQQVVAHKNYSHSPGVYTHDLEGKEFDLSFIQEAIDNINRIIAVRKSVIKDLEEAIESVKSASFPLTNTDSSEKKDK